MDKDARQGTLSRYIENRERTRLTNQAIPIPVHSPLLDFATDSTTAMEKGNKESFTKLTD